MVVAARSAGPAESSALLPSPTWLLVISRSLGPLTWDLFISSSLLRASVGGIVGQYSPPAVPLEPQSGEPARLQGQRRAVLVPGSPSLRLGPWTRTARRHTTEMPPQRRAVLVPGSPPLRLGPWTRTARGRTDHLRRQRRAVLVPGSPLRGTSLLPPLTSSTGRPDTPATESSTGWCDDRTRPRCLEPTR